MHDDGFIFDRETIARLLLQTSYDSKADDSTADDFTHKRATINHLPLVSLYRPEVPHPAPAKFVLFFADDMINMANILQFKQKINAQGVIAICPYHQYFDCLAYVDNIIFCQYKDIGYLLPWLISPLNGYVNIDSNDLRVRLNAHKFCYFSYFHSTKANLSLQFEIFIKQQMKNYLPPIKKKLFILDIFCSENFSLEDHQQISNIAEQAIDIADTDILYGLTFGMPSDEYAILELTHYLKLKRHDRARLILDLNKTNHQRLLKKLGLPQA